MKDLKCGFGLERHVRIYVLTVQSTRDFTHWSKTYIASFQGNVIQTWKQAFGNSQSEGIKSRKNMPIPKSTKKGRPREQKQLTAINDVDAVRNKTQSCHASHGEERSWPLRTPYEGAVWNRYTKAQTHRVHHGVSNECVFPQVGWGGIVCYSRLIVILTQ